jgi:UDPglucose--hexose-1-phosphate uridylyltransferase
MTTAQIETVVETWTRLYGAHLSPTSPLDSLWASNPLSKEPIVPAPKVRYRYMQIFENKGAAMGCSNPHPHGQAWTVEGMPEEPASELIQLMKHQQERGSPLLEEYVKLECEKKERIVFENKKWLVVCPWWATWPYEVMILSKEHKRALVDLDATDRLSLAEAISEVTTRYDNLFETHFPYSR